MTATTSDTAPYRLAITGDQVAPDGMSLFGDLELDRLVARGIDWSVIPVESATLSSDALAGFDALLMMGGAGLDATSLVRTRLRHVARFGAGYDAIDVAACTKAGVLLTNAPEAVRVPMAHAALGMLFALGHNLVVKDRLVREGRWDERAAWHGRGLQGATVGVVGLGGVGAEISRLLGALGIDVIGYNRTPRPRLGIAQLPLEDVAARSDYLVVAVSASPGTARLVDDALLGRMRPGSFLVNVSRGSVVDEDAVARRLASGHLRGAALDVFREEPLPATSPLVGSERTVLAPHSLGWTEGFASAVADDAIGAIIDVAEGRLPAHCVNPEAWRRTPARGGGR